MFRGVGVTPMCGSDLHTPLTLCHREAVDQFDTDTSAVRRPFSGEGLIDHGSDVILVDDLVVESSVSSIESPGGADQPDFMTSDGDTIADVSWTKKHRYRSRVQS